MGENEKLGFTFEVAPYDFMDFNRFFGATTPWVDEGSSTFPKVQRDSLYPPMSPSPLKEDSQVWNGSQRPNSEDYLKVREVIAPNGTRVIPKEEFVQELGGKPHRVVFDSPNCKLSYKDDMLVVDEFSTISDDTAQRLNKAFKDLQETMRKGFPMLFKKPTKRNKHYKPKFTL